MKSESEKNKILAFLSSDVNGLLFCMHSHPVGTCTASLTLGLLLWT